MYKTLAAVYTDRLKSMAMMLFSSVYLEQHKNTA